MSSEEFGWIGKGTSNTVPDAEHHRCKAAITEEDEWAQHYMMEQWTMKCNVCLRERHHSHFFRAAGKKGTNYKTGASCYGPEGIRICSDPSCMAQKANVGPHMIYPPGQPDHPDDQKREAQLVAEGRLMFQQKNPADSATNVVGSSARDQQR